VLRLDALELEWLALVLTRRRFAALTAALALSIGVATLALRRKAATSTEQRALGLAWGGFATTALDAAPLNGDHTLSVWFMTAYDASYRGVIVSDESGSYHLGMAPYSSLGQPALELTVGGATLTYPLPNAVVTDNDFRYGPRTDRGRRWRRLAVTRRGRTVVVAFDGKLVASFDAGELRASGKLRLGRLAHANQTQDQFYGFVDELALWGPGLDDATLEQLTATSGRASPAVGPRARLDFDAESPGRAALALGGSASLVALSSDHSAALDEPQLPSPQHATRLTLPFLPDQVWMPIQGSNSSLTHHDEAAFAIDFIRVDPRFVVDNRQHLPGGSHEASEGQPALAAAEGRVVVVVDSRADGARSETGQPLGNFVCLRHREAEFSCLLHLQTGAPAREQVDVAAGALLGRVGHSGAPAVHLHFALSNLPEAKTPELDSRLVTIPAAFSDYFVSTDFGASWRHVERGVPAPGEWLSRSRPRPSDARSR
jgi:hypothetical protein